MAHADRHHPGPGPERPLGAGARAGLLLAVLAALWLGQQALQANVEHACRESQWPGFARCPVERSSLSPAAQAEEAQRELGRLRARLLHNPGDAWAVTGMVVLLGQTAQDGAALTAAAAQLAPNRPEVLAQQALQALTRQDWDLAVPRLVLLATRHGHGEATRTLARLVGHAPQNAALMAALQAALRHDTDWLDQALRVLPAEKQAMAAAMPLVSTLALSGEMKPATGLLVIRQLKAENRWLDAHAVWLQLWKRPLGLLFNGDFEQRFVSDGFDWEVSDEHNPRTGAQMERVGGGERGQVLQLRFTGRPLRLPLVRQDLLLPAGSYRLEGDFQSVDLRSEGGLTWVLTCAGSGRELARSPPMRAAGRDWQSFEVRLSVPADCGGATLALQAQAAYEAQTGMRGQLLLDRMRLSLAEPDLQVPQR